MKRLYGLIFVLLLVLAFVPKVNAESSTPITYTTFLPVVQTERINVIVVCDRVTNDRQYGCVLLIGVYGKTLYVDHWSYDHMVELGTFQYQGNTYQKQGGVMLLDELSDYSALYTDVDFILVTRTESGLYSYSFWSK